MIQIPHRDWHRVVLTIPHFSSLFAADTYHNAARLRAPLAVVNNAA